MTIKIRVDLDTLQNSITVDEYLSMADGDIKAIIGLMSKFVLDESGQPLNPKDGRAAIGSLTMKEMEEVAIKFGESIKNVVPKANGSA